MSQALKDIRAELKAELANVKKTVAPPSGFRISTKGKIFTFPDGTQSDKPMEAIIVDWRSVNMFYKGVYNPNNIEVPSCFAINKDITVLAPSPNAKEPVHENCAKCPKNQWGSAIGGGKGKACKNTRLVAVIPADATSDTPVWVLKVSPTGLKSFDAYVNNLSDSLGKLPIEVITEIKFNANEQYPSLIFGNPTPHDILEVAASLRSSAATLLDKEPSGD